MAPYVIALTGASGVVYGIRLVKFLLGSGHSVELIISDSARLVLREEMGLALSETVSRESLASLFGDEESSLLRSYDPGDLTAPVGSGSYPTRGMVIVPCSMGTLGAVASGASRNLIHRAADCALKEGRKLVLVPRETPLSAIHLENLLKLSRAGAAIVPAMPAFYAGASQVGDMVDFVAGKILDQLGIPHALYPRWTGPVATSPASGPGRPLC